jgi:hypothetical protein
MLYDYKIYSKVFLHFSVGIKVYSIEEIRDVKKELESYLVKFHRMLRENGYLFRAFRIFDLAGNKRDGFLAHFHYAVLPERAWYKKYMRSMGKRFLNNAISKASNGKVKVFVGHGKAYKGGIFDYFSKRMSGKFGHRDQGSDFFLEDIMTYEQSEKIFRYMRKLVVTPPSGARITCIIGNVSFPGKQEHDDSDRKLEFLGISKNVKGRIPPPDGFKTMKVFCKWLSEQDCDSMRALNYDGMCLLEQFLYSDYEEFEYPESHETFDLSTPQLRINMDSDRWLDDY